MSKRPRVPKLSCHKALARAFVKHKGKFIYFGKLGTDRADESYRQWAARLLVGEPEYAADLADHDLSSRLAPGWWKS